jgi:hypothetical protein
LVFPDQALKFKKYYSQAFCKLAAASLDRFEINRYHTVAMDLDDTHPGQS